jgi:hypothetical protein
MRNHRLSSREPPKPGAIIGAREIIYFKLKRVHQNDMIDHSDLMREPWTALASGRHGVLDAGAGPGLAERGDIVVGFSESAEHVAADGPPPAHPHPLPPRRPEPAPGRRRFTAVPAPTRSPAAPARLHPRPRRRRHAQGQGGDDLLFGGPGGDRMGGEPGSDVFRFDGLLDMDRDYIHGLEVGADVLDFSPLHWSSRQGAFEATGQAQLRYVDDYTSRAAAHSPHPGSTHVYLGRRTGTALRGEMTVEHRALTNTSFLV